MSILNIAYSGLNAFQRAIDVAGNNMTNVGTRGYSRQTIHFSPAMSQRYAGSFIGSGVNVTSIERNADQFANYQVRSTLSAKSEFESFYQQAVQIDKLLSQDGTSISSSMQSFFDSLGELNSNPGSGAIRGVTLKQTQLLAQQFNSLQKQLDEYQSNSTAQITQTVGQINQIARSIAAVNLKLMSSPDAPELLDQRDELLRQLSEFVDVTSFDQGDGTISVGIGSGEMLVSGTEQRNLVVSSDRSNSLGTKVFLDNGGGQIDISNRLTSGKLGGLMDYENNIIGKASQMIGQMAIGLAQKFNAQHLLGMDMNDQIGKNFFTDYNAMDVQLNRAFPSTQNTGNGVLSVNISDIGQTQLSDYELIVSDAGSNELRLIRKSDGTSTIMNWNNNPPAPPAGQIIIDGMTITVDDTSQLANNDTFTLTPTRSAARGFDLLIKNPDEIALASPVKTSAATTNRGQGQIELGQVFNTTGVNKQYRIEFISDTQYNIVNVTDSTTTGPLAFVPNTNNTIQIPDGSNPSYSVVLSGLPQASDQFIAEYNNGGIGDNRNGLSLAGIQQGKFFANGSQSLFDRYANLLADVGGKTNQAKQSFDSADIIYKQAVDFQASKSGVNLDEEGINLLRFKQAYEAAGKLLEISSQMMNMLIDIMR